MSFALYLYDNCFRVCLSYFIKNVRKKNNILYLMHEGNKIVIGKLLKLKENFENLYNRLLVLIHYTEFKKLYICKHYSLKLFGVF